MPAVIIKTMNEAVRKLARYIREFENDKISTEKFRALVYGISNYINNSKTAKEIEDFEQRLQALESNND
jgi:hypothetical protein